ncbi:hypothetical protein [Haloglomus litoreum]|uniref:hypothetical protein n=1 Tax=Haloglomus litoreum TaxID=3034026 RepID=UPI0023E86162|nr:hypothetical protein [Haloglomus sp. DT116]
MAVREGRTRLDEMNGSGDNVFVIATVTHIQDLNSAKPYQKGLLRDGSMSAGDVRPFVVYDPDIRLEKGTRYKMNGFDHPYEPYEEIQLLLGEDAYVEVCET